MDIEIKGKIDIDNNREDRDSLADDHFDEIYQSLKTLGFYGVITLWIDNNQSRSIVVNKPEPTNKI